MAKAIITTKQAPAAICPYSQAVRAGPFVYTSGQIPLDPQTGKIVAGDIAVQTRRVLENLKAVLAADGLSLSDVVKTTVFVRDIRQFPTVNQAYAEYFPKDPPARSTVEVSALPLNAEIEIEVVAFSER